MKVIIGEHITTPYSDINGNMLTIEAANYQKCNFDVRALMPNIQRSIFEDCIFENMEFTQIAPNTVFRRCIFKKVRFYDDPRPRLEGVIFDKCKFISSRVSWRMEDGVIDAKFDECGLYELRFNNSSVKLEFEKYSQNLCYLIKPHSAAIAPYESLAFSNCSKLELLGFVKNEGHGIVICDEKDIAKIGMILGINRDSSYN